jgi:hypothetical protein
MDCVLVMQVGRSLEKSAFQYSSTLISPAKWPVVELCFDLRNIDSTVSGKDRLCGLVDRVVGYRCGGPCSIPGTTRKKVVGLEWGPLSLVSTTEELLDRKVAAPV